MPKWNPTGLPAVDSKCVAEPSEPGSVPESDGKACKVAFTTKMGRHRFLVIEHNGATVNVIPPNEVSIAVAEAPLVTLSHVDMDIVHIGSDAKETAQRVLDFAKGSDKRPWTGLLLHVNLENEVKESQRLFHELLDLIMRQLDYLETVVFDIGHAYIVYDLQCLGCGQEASMATHFACKTCRLRTIIAHLLPLAARPMSELTQRLSRHYPCDEKKRSEWYSIVIDLMGSDPDAKENLWLSQKEAQMHPIDRRVLFAQPDLRHLAESGKWHWMALAGSLTLVPCEVVSPTDASTPAMVVSFHKMVEEWKARPPSRPLRLSLSGLLNDSAMDSLARIASYVTSLELRPATGSRRISLSFPMPALCELALCSQLAWDGERSMPQIVINSDCLLSLGILYNRLCNITWMGTTALTGVTPWRGNLSMSMPCRLVTAGGLPLLTPEKLSIFFNGLIRSDDVVAVNRALGYADPSGSCLRVGGVKHLAVEGPQLDVSSKAPTKLELIDCASLRSLSLRLLTVRLVGPSFPHLRTLHADHCAGWVQGRFAALQRVGGDSAALKFGTSFGFPLRSALSMADVECSA